MPKKVLCMSVVGILCLAMLMGCGAMKFDQETHRGELITKKYSTAQIEALQRNVQSGGMSYVQFKRQFKAECVRQTHQGYYVVLLAEDGRNAFAFFNNKDVLINVIVANGFMDRAEFESRVTVQMNKAAVLQADPQAIPAPVSAVDISIHIVKKGVFLLKYTREADSSVVATIEFVSNESLPTHEDPFVTGVVPYILAIDKRD